MNYKSERGIGLSDAVIAIIILMIFTGIVVTISYNIYMQSNFIKRNDVSTNYIVELFEFAKKIDFDTVTYENLRAHFTDTNLTITTDNNTVGKGYTMIIGIEEIEPSYSKRITAIVKYKLGDKVKSVSMNTIINK